MRLGPWFLVSSRLEEMRRFYTEVVGLPVAHEEAGHHVWYSLGAIELAVHAPEPEPGPDFTPAERGILMWFESEHPLADVAAELRAHGAPVWGPFESERRELLYSLDPESNMVGLFKDRIPATSPQGEPNGPDGAAAMNARMVERAKASGAIRSVEVETAFRTTPRHVFLPGVGLDTVYSGSAVVTRSDPQGRPTSSSSEVAVMGPMLEALAVRRGQRVLEIGVGTGYNAALLNQLVGAEGEVVSVEVQEDVAAEARRHLAAAGHGRVEVVVGDGYQGYVARAPYDRIIATASVSDIPRAWRDQLRGDGLLAVPLRLRPSAQVVATFRRVGGQLESVAVVPGGFMALRTGQQSIEPPISLEGDWEATVPAARDGDAAILSELLKTGPAVETSRPVPWPVTFSLVGLIDPDWIVLSQRQRPTTWQGLFDRDSKSLALAWPIPIPIGMGRSSLLVYGAPRARDRLSALLDELADVVVDRVRIKALPKEERAPSADLVLDGENFRYAIDWRAAKVITT